MILTKPVPFIKQYIEDLNNTLEQYQPGARLTLTQKAWLVFCLSGILMVNAVCWAKFERVSLGTHKIATLSWMFRQSKILWDNLLIASVRLMMNLIVPALRIQNEYTKFPSHPIVALQGRL